MLDITPKDGIFEFALKRPPVNALDSQLLKVLRVALEAAPQHGARGIILSGGQKVFSGGMDVPHLMSLDREGLTACWSEFFAVALALARSPVPVAAAIAGHNPAGGCVLALCCDYRVMARGPFRIGLNETQVGLVVPDAIQYLLRRVVGHHRAERMIVSGAMIESEQAHALGMVDELAEPDAVVAHARTWLEQLLALPSSPMLASRAIARADVIGALEAFNGEALNHFLDDWYSPDTQSALQALMSRLGKKASPEQSEPTSNSTSNAIH